MKTKAPEKQGGKIPIEVPAEVLAAMNELQKLGGTRAIDKVHAGALKAIRDRLKEEGVLNSVEASSTSSQLTKGASN